MRRMIGTLAVAGMIVVGAGGAKAQDAASMASAQAAQQSMDLALQASQQATQMMMQAAQQANQMMMQAASQNAMQAPMDSSTQAWLPMLPVTPSPVIAKLKDGVRVILYDVDPKAIVFYTTDGSVPTLRSQRYVGPIVVGSKVKVRAMAFDLECMPSGVVSRTFRVKS
jgi:hypothetical protein